MYHFNRAFILLKLFCNLFYGSVSNFLNFIKYKRSHLTSGLNFVICLFLVGNLFFSNTALSKEEDPKIIIKKLVEQKRKKGVVVNYHHFYETYQALKNGSYYEDESMLYGFGVSYEDNWYSGKIGWGYQAELAQGVAVAGTAGNSRYYQTRVPFQIIAVGGRFFKRWNAFFEIGPSVVVQYKNMKWPDDSGYQVQAPQNPTLGVYLEVRTRLNTQFDLIQKVGLLGKSKIASWNLGVGYNF